MDIIESKPRSGHSRLVAIGLVGAGLVAGGTLATLGVASAAGTGSSTTNPTPTATCTPRHGLGPLGGRMGRGMAHGIHGSETVASGVGTYLKVDNQRGTVTANDGTTITVKSVDGFSAAYAFDAKSVIVKNRVQVRIADLRTGDTVDVRAVEQASGSPVVALALDGLPSFGGPDGGMGRGGLQGLDGGPGGAPSVPGPAASPSSSV